MIYKEKSCHLEYAISKFGGKWKAVILWYLGKYGVHRYGQLKKILEGITAKMLTQVLKELEQDGLIIRTQYNEVPPRVEYALSPKGKTLMPILDLMYDWGNRYN